MMIAGKAKDRIWHLIKEKGKLVKRKNKEGVELKDLSLCELEALKYYFAGQRYVDTWVTFNKVTVEKFKND